MTEHEADEVDESTEPTQDDDLSTRSTNARRS